MNPRLVALAGPLKDSTFVLPPGEMPVGRDASNLLPVSDPSVSRRHCILSREDQGCKIRDLDSRNGTQVNGVPVREHWLGHGDQIAIGDSVFLFLLEEDAAESPQRVEFEDNQATQATAQLRPQDVLYLQPDRLLRELPSTSRLACNLNALLKISRVVHSIRELEELQAQILDLLFEVVPAERGAILLGGKNGENFASIHARDRLSASAHPVRVSRTITRQVLQQGVAILGSDVPGSGGFNGVESVVTSQVHSLLCVPLLVFSQVMGCIYLDSTNPLHRFDQDHLELVTAIAGISAVALENARRLQWLEQENRRLTAEINLEHNMVGEGPRMKEVYQFLARVAPSNSTVLIEGESGTGKELAARALHRNSSRANGPFVAINCAAIPEALLESELFGHEKGAFTGAYAQKKGRLEMADNGVVFLDEIGDLAPALQIKLLRVLQEREFERLGGTRPISVDVRFIAATNSNLEQAVKSGAFRQDLYYRLKVVSLVMPPLRERKEDIPLLASYFAVKYSRECKVKLKEISPDAMACLVNYDWPGNVRELENAIERALVLGSGEMILPEDLPEPVLEKELPPGMAAAKYHGAIKELKKQLIRKALGETNGNYTAAAKWLGVHPNYLHRLIRNLDLKADGKKAPNPHTSQRKI